MAKLDVLHVHLGRRDGGAERRTVALLAGLARSGHRVLAIVRRGTPMERRALAAAAPIFPLEPRYPLGPRGLFSWWSRGRLRRIASGAKWDVVHFADPESHALAAGALRSGMGGNGTPPTAKSVVTYAGGEAGRNGRVPSSLRRHHAAGGIIAPLSEALWAALVREKFDEDLLSVVHPGIDLKAFSRDEAARQSVRREMGWEHDAEIVGTVTVMDRDRGTEAFLEAAALLATERARTRFVVVGDGVRRPSLERRTRDLGLAGLVTFTGWREDVAPILNALDAYVFPGQGEEVFPLSLIEAMAAGVPVVVRDQPGIREIIENGKQGLIVPGNDAAALARTIARVFAESSTAKPMGRAGAVRVQRFNAQAMVDATEGLYYRMLNK